MSLTSYRAAPPRVGLLDHKTALIALLRFGAVLFVVCPDRLDDLAATYSPVP